MIASVLYHLPLMDVKPLILSLPNSEWTSCTANIVHLSLDLFLRFNTIGEALPPDRLP